MGPDLFRAALVHRGYQEAITYSFVDRDLDRTLGPGGAGVPLANPLSADLAVMRQSLWPGLVQALRYNLARQQSRVRLFETGTRFTGGAAALTEEAVLSGIVAGAVNPEQWGEKARTADFFDVKADLEALLAAVGPASEFEWRAESHPALQPGQSCRLIRQGRQAGWLGVLHPLQRKACGLDAAPVLFELDLEVLAAAAPTTCGEVSRFPSVRRDIALVVKRPVAVSSLVQAARAAGGEALRDIVVFDIFAGGHIDASEKSVALGLILQETSRTLTDADTDAIIGGVIRRLATDFDARIRE
ncbi:MAG: hypothetical protein J0M16_04640 [Gammaproteobacteria bacterium]|nr:hypothetical protein [Gammaproteobacteria bacterium]